VTTSIINNIFIQSHKNPNRVLRIRYRPNTNPHAIIICDVSYDIFLFILLNLAKNFAKNKKTCQKNMNFCAKKHSIYCSGRKMDMGVHKKVTKYQHVIYILSPYSTYYLHHIPPRQKKNYYSLYITSVFHTLSLISCAKNTHKNRIKTLKKRLLC